ncbi:hypothetical protein HK102_002110 [Quaeritorhiza haematococci]|nr:hypothetical protein HK102_002110 [Quaeritorhiza haematococci]
MQGFVPREGRFLVLEPGSYHSKIGFADHLTNPSIITSCVGIKTLSKGKEASDAPQSPSQQQSSDMDIDQPLTEAPPASSSTSDNPSASADAKDDAKKSEADTATSAEANTEEKQDGKATEEEEEYLCGRKLEAEGEGAGSTSLRTVWPIRNGYIKDWDCLEVLWKHMLVQEMGVRRQRNDAPVLISVPSWWSKKEYERITQMMFEKFNTPGIQIVQQPLMALYGCGLTSGLVIDMGHQTSVITPITDNNIIQTSQKMIPMGGELIDKVLAKMLNEDATFRQQFEGENDVVIDEEMARSIKHAGLVEIAPVPFDESVESLAPCLPPVEHTYKGRKFNVGPVRFKCTEFLFDPEKLTGVISQKEIQRLLSLAEAMWMAVSSADQPDKRLNLWENVLLTGGGCQLKGLKQRLEYEIAPYIAASETSNEFQAKEIKFVRVPEYLTAYKEKQQDVGFVGGIIVAKLTFPDMKNYVTKVDYNQLGPASINLKA